MNKISIRYNGDISIIYLFKKTMDWVVETRVVASVGM